MISKKQIGNYYQRHPSFLHNLLITLRFKIIIAKEIKKRTNFWESICDTKKSVYYYFAKQK